MIFEMKLNSAEDNYWVTMSATDTDSSVQHMALTSGKTAMTAINAARLDISRMETAFDRFDK